MNRSVLRLPCLLNVFFFTASLPLSWSPCQALPVLPSAPKAGTGSLHKSPAAAYYPDQTTAAIEKVFKQILGDYKISTPPMGDTKAQGLTLKVDSVGDVYVVTVTGKVENGKLAAVLSRVEVAKAIVSVKIAPKLQVLTDSLTEQPAGGQKPDTPPSGGQDTLKGTDLENYFRLRLEADPRLASGNLTSRKIADALKIRAISVNGSSVITLWNPFGTTWTPCLQDAGNRIMDSLNPPAPAKKGTGTSPGNGAAPGSGDEAPSNPVKKVVREVIVIDSSPTETASVIRSTFVDALNGTQTGADPTTPGKSAEVFVEPLGNHCFKIRVYAALASEGNVDVMRSAIRELTQFYESNDIHLVLDGNKHVVRDAIIQRRWALKFVSNKALAFSPFASNRSSAAGSKDSGTDSKASGSGNGSGGQEGSGGGKGGGQAGGGDGKGGGDGSNGGGATKAADPKAEVDGANKATDASPAGGGKGNGKEADSSGNSNSGGGGNPAASPPGGTPSGTSQDSVDRLVSALNTAYGTASKGGLTVQRDERDLFITGPESQVNKVIGMLAMIDTAWPQIQMDMWPIQLSGNANEISRQANRISQAISGVRQEVDATQGLIRLALEGGSQLGFSGSAQPDLMLPAAPTLQQKMPDLHLPSLAGPELDTLFRNMNRLGFNHLKEDRLSLIESLLWLALASNRSEPPGHQGKGSLIDNLQQLVKSFWHCEQVDLGNREIDLENQKHRLRSGITTKTFDGVRRSDATELREALAELDEELGAVREQRALIMSRLLKINDTFAPTQQTFVGALKPFRHLEAAFYSGFTNMDRKAVEKFLTAAEHYRMFVQALDEGVEIPAHAVNGPYELQREAASVDGGLKVLLAAYVDDMDEMYLHPLMRHIQRGLGSNANGISLAGRTRLVVTSGMETDLSAQLNSYANSTRVAPLSAAEISAAVGSGAGLANLTTIHNYAQAIQLLAQLGGDVPPVYTTVTPGVQVAVRPTVLPDSNEARLEMQFLFGVSTTAPTASTDVWATKPPDAVVQHLVQTDAIVTGFNLFNISSFNMETSTPQAPWSIPLLGRIPVLGQIFQWPRGPRTVYHASMVLVNATILPRSMSLLGYYAQNPYSSKDGK